MRYNKEVIVKMPLSLRIPPEKEKMIQKAAGKAGTVPLARRCVGRDPGAGSSRTPVSAGVASRAQPPGGTAPAGTYFAPTWPREAGDDVVQAGDRSRSW